MGEILARYFTLWSENDKDPTFISTCVEALYVEL